MAKRGPKPTPTATKRARGETQESRIGAESVVEFPLVKEVPDPPDWLEYSDSLELWGEIAPVLFAQRVMTEPDVHALAHLCQMHGEIIDGYRRRNKATAADLSQLRMYFSEFGMTPASRTRLSPAKGKEPGNKFQDNGRPPRTS